MDNFTVRLLLILLSVSCTNCASEDLTGRWVVSDPTTSIVDEVVVNGETLVFKDRYGGSSAGYVLNDSVMRLRTELGIATDFSYKYINVDDKISIESISFDRYADVYLLDDSIQGFDLISIGSIVTFPFLNQTETPHQLVVKLRNQNAELPLYLGARAANLDELWLYAPSVVCTSTRPRKVNYTEAIIFIEEGASVQDLLTVERQLYLQHGFTTFTLIVGVASPLRYNAIIDSRLLLPQYYSRLCQSVNEALNAGANGNFRCPPPFPISELSTQFIKSSRFIHHRVNELNDIEKMKVTKTSFGVIHLVFINPMMPIEEYLYVLSQLQTIRISTGSTIITKAVAEEW